MACLDALLLHHKSVCKYTWQANGGKRNIIVVPFEIAEAQDQGQVSVCVLCSQLHLLLTFTCVKPRYLSSQHGDVLYDELGSTKCSVGMPQHL